MCDVVTSSVPPAWQSGWGQGQSLLQARPQATGPAQLWKNRRVSEEFGLGRSPDTQWGHSHAYYTHTPTLMYASRAKAVWKTG